MVSLTSQLIAFRRLSAAEDQRALAARRLSSGLNLADRTDTADTLSLSRRLTRATGQLSSVQSSLDGGIAAVSASAGAVEATGSTLAGLRAVLVAAKDPSADLGALQSRFTALAGQLRAGVAGAARGSVNLLATSGSTRYDAAPTDERGQTFSIGVDAERIRLLDTTGTSGILQRPFDLGAGAPAGRRPATGGLAGTALPTEGEAAATPSLDGLSGTAVVTAGLAAAVPSDSGLSGGVTAVRGASSLTPATDGLAGTGSATTGVAARDALAAVAQAGTYSAAGANGDTVRFDVTLNGTGRSVQVYQRGATTAAAFRSALQSALDGQFGSDRITARVGGDNAITLTTVARGGAQSLAVANVSVTDGDDVTTSKLGLSEQGDYSALTVREGAGDYSYDSLGTFSNAGLDRGDRLRLMVRARETSGTVHEMTLDISLSAVTDAASFAAAINEAATRQTYYGQPVGNFAKAVAQPDGEIRIVLRSTGSKVYVSQLTALEGNGAAAGTLGLAGGSGSGRNGVAATAASLVTGTGMTAATELRGDAALSFDVKAGGTTTNLRIDRGTVDAALSGQSGHAAGSGRIADAAQLARVVERALQNAGLSGVAVGANGNALRFALTGTPADGDTIELSAVTATANAPVAASLTTGSDFAGPLTLRDNDSLAFTLAMDGAPGHGVTIGRSDVDAALSGRAGYAPGSGTIATAAELALVVEGALGRQGVAGVSVAAAGERLRFGKTTPGDGSLALGGVAGLSRDTQAVTVTGSDFTGPIVLARESSIGFDMALDGGAPRRLTITRTSVETALAGVAGRTAGTGRIASAGELALVMDQALRDAGIAGVTAEAAGRRLRLARTAAGPGRIEFGAVGATSAAATSATLLTGSDFAGPATLDPGASIRFAIAADGGGFTSVPMTRSTVETALAGVAGRAGGTGTIADAGQLALVVRQALADASVAGVAVRASGARLEFSRTIAGAGRIDLGAVSAVAGPARATTIDSLDLDGDAVRAASPSERTALIDAFIRDVDAMTASVAAAGSHLAAVGRQLAIQSAHTTRLQAIETGRLNGQVKIDLDRETAKKTALDARLALARQSLAIISESRRNVLNLLPPMD